MSNQTPTAVSRIRSKLAGHRLNRKFYRDVHTFGNKYNANVWIIEWQGPYRCIIQSEAGLNASAWGATRAKAFYNMITKFNIKYPQS